MTGISRRTILSSAVSATLAMPTACSPPPEASRPTAPNTATNEPTPAPSKGGRPTSDGNLIGDGSTANTGPQPNQPKAERLKAGERPPQFVVFSWDGAGATADGGQFARFLKIGREYKASMTFFLSGIYLLPESKKALYHPPRHRVGESDIGYLTDQHIHDTLELLGTAWRDGHEIGTHFNGHFLSGRSDGNGVGKWTSAEWEAEIEQVMAFVMNWRTHTGFADLPPLPFDYRKELIGGRTPGLEGQKALLPAAVKLGWRYDASSPGQRQIWPQKVLNGKIWDLPLQTLPFPGRGFETLSMDYNIMANQSDAGPKGDPAKYDAWRIQARDCYLAGFNRAYEGNRAPLFIGNHFQQWNGGIYMDAVEQTIKAIADKPDVRLVSFRQLVDWLDTQDESTLRKLRTLGVGQAPTAGWKQFLDTVG
ncbi:hypothetical protein [Kitasatospora sp. NPDC059327]|uniref:hypothetical protein n=1 Tax=Kitasatospora sp. NPDC059327 TaxID=3346803 RepID=UPI003678E7BE